MTPPRGHPIRGEGALGSVEVAESPSPHSDSMEDTGA